MHGRLLQAIAAIASCCIASECKILQASATFASSCVASYCEPLRLSQTVSLQDIASHCSYYKLLHRRLLQGMAPIASYCKLAHYKLLRDCGYCKLLHLELLQAIEAIASYSLASCCMPLCFGPHFGPSGWFIKQGIQPSLCIPCFLLCPGGQARPPGAHRASKWRPNGLQMFPKWLQK